MKAAGRLNSTVPNQLYYASDPWSASTTSGCHDPARYQDFLFKFSINRNHQAYRKAQSNTCYKQSVFGFYSGGFDKKEVIHYMFRSYGITTDKCKHPTITIQQRECRSILNAEQLQNTAKSKGFKYTEIVIFEKLSLQEQLQVIACTDVLVGIQGAGLEWIYFMQPGTALMELAWPQKYWPYVYTSKAQSQKLQTKQLNAAQVILNTNAYLSKIPIGHPHLSMAEVQSLATAPPKNQVYNPWKWADAIFDVQTFVINLQEFSLRISNNTYKL